MTLGMINWNGMEDKIIGTEEHKDENNGEMDELLKAPRTMTEVRVEREQ